MNQIFEAEDLVFYKNDPGRVYSIYWANEQLIHGSWMVTDYSIVKLSELQKSDHENAEIYHGSNVIHDVKPSQLRLV